jgi:small subunit ribosomal protein S22
LSLQVSHRIYDHAAETKSFDALRSTRFFGPMAFYLAWNKNVELLLIDMIERDL